MKRLYLPDLEAQLAQERGDTDGALVHYREAVTRLGRAGQFLPAGRSLWSFAVVSVLTGQTRAALAFAQGQKLQGEQFLGISLLEWAWGNQPEAERSLQQFAATHPWISPKAAEIERVGGEMFAALLHNDGQTALAAARRIPDFRFEWLQFAKARACLLVNDSPNAEMAFRHARGWMDLSAVSYRLPLGQVLSHFYLGQIYAAAGKRQDAANEYQEFLSHFQGSRASLPQVAEARAALALLMP